ncbi:adenylate/guanylate cyclase domain-containing protein [Mycobacterium riyadhense]|uniref:adenylate/guanylate cyclase domain-containing protein n=1 Tax=Mycobacterium riyadhense TaxID=486698 RepID=UPI00195D33B1|nr:adenylate/guanylate cyclase domain-containing protein [Mycobacterium riyadhense]
MSPLKASNKSIAQRLGRALEMVTRQSGRLTATPEYGSWLLGRVSDSRSHRWRRMKLIVYSHTLLSNVTGIAVAVLVLSFAFPAPSIYTDAPRWVTVGVAPAYATFALALGTYWITTRIVTGSTRWAIEERRPSTADERNTLLAPFRVAVIHVVLWDFGAVLLATLYGLANRLFIPIILFTVSICGVLVATNSYLFTEFALRPVAAQALEAGRTPRRFVSGIMGRTMTVWTLGSGAPLAGIALTALFALLVHDLTETQLGVAILILATATLIFGFLVMWIVSWLTATPVRVVRAALKRVEQGDLHTDVVVFDGSELGELQRGFNAMVNGLRERERIRDLFGRHVGRDVAAAAERERPKLGGEERHVAVVFIDIIGSTQLVRSRPPGEVVHLLNRFFTIVVEEVDRHSGLVNKFEGDASLAIFGAPNRLDCPEDEALAAARAMAQRLATQMPECQAGIGVAAGQVVAGNVGAHERFEYTVIGEPVNEAARLCELAKSHPDKLLASAATLDRASENERAQWSLGETVTLRGHDESTQLAHPS